MLDPLQQAFETAMKAKATARPRPAGTRRAELIDNSSVRRVRPSLGGASPRFGAKRVSISR